MGSFPMVATAFIVGYTISINNILYVSILLRYRKTLDIYKTECTVHSLLYFFSLNSDHLNAYYVPMNYGLDSFKIINDC